MTRATGKVARIAGGTAEWEPLTLGYWSPKAPASFPRMRWMRMPKHWRSRSLERQTSSSGFSLITS